MNITAEERQMYAVMKAIYDSGISISFKGSMVLKACLLEAGYAEDTRHTVDIDANWYSETAPTAEQLTDSLRKALEHGGIHLNVSLYRMYGDGRSAGFELSDRDTGDILFTMDMDVNRPVQPTQIYSVDGLLFRGISPAQILADKISAVSTEKVFRRIKDVVDLYYLSQVIAFDAEAIRTSLDIGGRTLGDFSGFLRQTDALRHAYEKFRFAGDVSKPPFEDVCSTVKDYIREFLPREQADRSI